MSKEHFSIFGKIISLILLSLIFLPPVASHASMKNLILLPFTVYADQSKSYLGQGIKSMLISRISGGDIEIIPDEKYIHLLGKNKKQGITSKKSAEELARGCNADYAIFGSITTIGGGYSLDISLLEIAKNKLTRISKAVNENQLIPQLSDIAYTLRALMQGREILPPSKTAQPVASLPEPQIAKGIFSTVASDKQGSKNIEKGIPFKPTKEYQEFKPTGKISVGMPVMAFDMGDLDGKAGAELLILGRKKLLLYTRQGESFALKDTLKTSLGEDFFKVSVGDVDNNGRAEIYLVSRYGIRARSTVFEWAGEFKRLDRLTGHMKVINEPVSNKAILLFQNSKVDEFFSGRIYVMKFDEGGKLIKGEKLPELDGCQFYTLALFDLDKKQETEWVGLGEPNLGGESNLYVWDRAGAIIWMGKKGLGGTNNAIRLEEGKPEGHLPPKILFNSRLIIADIDGDGEEDIVAVKNINPLKYLENINFYTKANLIVYRREGLSLSLDWTTGDIGWCVTDMQVDGQTLFLAAQKGKFMNIIGKGSSQIMWFE